MSYFIDGGGFTTLGALTFWLSFGTVGGAIFGLIEWVIRK